MPSSSNTAAGVLSAYAVAFLDWLACACAGADQRGALAVREAGGDLLSDVAFAGTAGHVLDFDDTFSDGLAHVSAPTAPASLVLASALGLSLRAMLEAFAEGFEAMAALAEASHPALYDRGWHPTAVCGPVGACIAAARLLGLSSAQRENAIALALLRAGGARGAFGSDGKAIQVGLAAAAGVQAALIARAGATVGRRATHGSVGFEGVLGARWPEPRVGGDLPRAIDRNWIKLYPSCLGTHSPIDAALAARERGLDDGEIDRSPLEVLVHPVARQAAHIDTPEDGLSAKFSIPYCVAYALINGPPRVGSFADLDAAVQDRSRRVSVGIEPSLPEFGAVLRAAGRDVAHVPCPRGAPERPATTSDLAAKLADLAGDRLDGLFDDLGAPASVALQAAGLSTPSKRSADPAAQSAREG